MKVSYKWLKTMVDVPDDPGELVAELIRTGTEVEAVEKTGANLDNVVVGHILECVEHPNSDHMHITTVDVGESEPLQIVCGAPNVAKGEKVAVALIGAKLPGDVVIKKSKLRGIESCGMNCSERELGIGSDHEGGIMLLPEDAPVGLPIATYLGIEDTIIDCEITPNRPDCLSMMGFATEVGAILNKPVKFETPVVAQCNSEKAEDIVDVKIDTELCTRYVARVVKDVKIAPSPKWLAERVIASGSRPINNVVDVTNYVMFLTGQPLHAFDLGKLSIRDGKHHIVVRAANNDEKIVTLDNQERTLTSDMALISDDGGAGVALAGVMGGLNSEIDETTTSVLLESACFNPGHTSRTSRDLGLMSEASIRFERKVNADACAEVADIAAALFESCCSASVCAGSVDVYPEPLKCPVIELRPSRVCALSGTEIPKQFMAQVLTRMGCEVTSKGSDKLQVVAPFNRPDLTREADLVEEVLRTWGMDKVEARIPAAVNHTGGLSSAQKQVKRIGSMLRACGMSETLNYNFVPESDIEIMSTPHEDGSKFEPVRIINPLSADQSVLRISLLPGLLRSVSYNLAHGEQNICLYEQGRIFIPIEGEAQPSELHHVAGVMCGKWHADSWCEKSSSFDFFDAKGIVSKLMDSLKVGRFSFSPAKGDKFPWLQPGRAAEVKAAKHKVGWVGNVHPLVLKQFDIDFDVVAFELNQDALLAASTIDFEYVDVPTMPSIEVDLAIVLPEDVDYTTAIQRIQSAGGNLLESVSLFDVYRDAVRIGKDKKSMAFKLVFRAKDHTLTSEEVDSTIDKLVNKISKSLGAEVRGR